ncbi:hypothetical protein [Parabacteroides goldsteinii]|uniref:hypothetical protein n=1 Tax=Parabacteroides goldsteinii TaxID=328812 RepID=UPI00101CDB3D|nr:hypothetical protein [Parabacteroides goldsteinii]
MKSFFIFIVTCLFFVSCEKEESLLISQDQKNIEIIENIARSKGFDVIANKAKGIRTTPLTEEEIAKYEKHFSNLSICANLTSENQIEIIPFENNYIERIHTLRGYEITRTCIIPVSYMGKVFDVELMWGEDESNNDVLWAGAWAEGEGITIQGNRYRYITAFQEPYFSNNYIDIVMYVNYFENSSYDDYFPELSDYADYVEHFSITGTFNTRNEQASLSTSFMGLGKFPLESILRLDKK